jgi:general secretion pathway protein D
MKYVNVATDGMTDRHTSTPAVLTLFLALISLLTIAGGGTAGIVTTPVSPKLISPGSLDQAGAEVATLTPDLTWEQVFDAQLYSVYVRKSPFTENDVVFKHESISKPFVTVPPASLLDGEKYRWYVRAFNRAGWSDKSQIFSFTVSLPSDGAAPWLVAPGSTGKPVPILTTTSPTFRWKAVPNAKRYGLYISKYPYGNKQVIYRNESITDTAFTLPKGFLFPSQIYRWSVKSQTRTGWSEPSRRFYFAVKAPTHPILPNDVIVEGELPRRDFSLTGLYTPLPVSADARSQVGQVSPLLPSATPQQLAQREMPPSIPSRPGAEPPPLPPSSPAPAPRDVPAAKPPPSGPLPKAVAASPVSSNNQSREAQAQRPSAPPNEARPAVSPTPTAQNPRVPSQPMTPATPAPSPAPSPRQSSQISAPSAGSMVQMQFDNIELRDLIKFVSNIMGKNFIFDDVVVKGKVTILSPKSLTRDEVFRVFESVLNYYGFSIVSSPEAYKVVKSSDAKALAIESIDRERLLTAAPEERVATLIHPLEYLDSNTMVGILRPLMARDAYLVSVPATNSLIMIDTSANLQRLKKLVGELDIPVSKQLSSIEVYNVQHTTAADLAKTLQALLAEGKKAVTPKEKIFITSYAPTNSLLVSAPAEDMKDIKRIIVGIDTVRPQVLVEAAIIEVSLTKAGSLGVDWVTGFLSDNGRGAIGGVFNPGAPIAGLAGAIAKGDPALVAAAASNLSGFNVGVFGGNITFNGQTFPSIGAFIRAIATENSVNILSTPQILTMNNEEAEIVVGENRPYLTTSRLDSAGNPINTFDYRDVGIKLKVKPYINKDGLVYLTLYQEVTKVTEATVGSGSSTQPAPTTLKRSTKTTVGIKDSQTIVISGLIRDDSGRTTQGIPFLSSIPVLGALFGVQTRTADKTNLLVFITPRIIYSSGTIEEISQQMQKEQEKLINQQSGIKKEKKQEIERVKEIEKE